MGEIRASVSEPMSNESGNSVKSLIANLISKVALLTRAESVNPMATHSPLSYQKPSRQFAWGIDDPVQFGPGITFPESSPAKGLVLYRSDATTVTLEQLAGSITLVLLASREMSILPGIWHRISRRAETLGQGVRLVCIVEHPSEVLPAAFVDRDRQIRLLAGRHEAPILLSLDQRGNVFDVVSNAESIMDWLWNDPRPLSFRANGAVGLDDLVG